MGGQRGTLSTLDAIYLFHVFQGRVHNSNPLAWLKAHDGGVLFWKVAFISIKF